MSQPILPPLWSPSDAVVERARVTEFQRLAEERTGRTFSNYEDLWEWSTRDLGGFWATVAEYFGVTSLSAASEVLAIEAMPGSQWFPGVSTNFAAHVLAQGEPEEVAVIGLDEDGDRSALTRAQLRDAVAAVARELRVAGVTRGNRVVGYVPNIAEAVVAMLAAASIGAIWSSVGMDYAANAAIDRLGPLEPVVLVYATGYRYGGRVHDRREAVEALVAGLPTLAGVIEVPRVGLSSGEAWPSVRKRSWEQVVAASTDRLADGADHAEPMGFDDPLWVLFSSGTTGPPKGIVQSHGGVLLELLKFVGLHFDQGPGDRFFWFTSPSWVMWNIQVSALATGASIVCYDGAPTYPDANRLWRVIAETGTTLFGSSPGYLEASRATGIRPAQDLDLPHLRALATTGSPISPSTHEWAVQASGGLPVYSASGGTDVCGGLCGGVPTVPTWPGELSVRNLGVAMEAWDEEGKPLVGEVGELVITRPLLSMPIWFWNDSDGTKYRDAYFDTYPGVWRHGDWITITDRSSVVVHGRSDSTLNRNGVRMGSADIYNALIDVAGIIDSLVLGVEEADGGYWMPLFVVLPEGTDLDDDLRQRIRAAIREQVSPRHVPDDIIQVDGIPHTRTGKRLEVPLKRLMQGAEPSKVVQTAAIDNPDLLAPFLELAKSRRTQST